MERLSHFTELVAAAIANTQARSALIESRARVVAAGDQIHVQQGVEIGRASDLFLSADLVSGKVSDVRVGGSTVLVAKGQLFLP